uniref:Uncharacterized protein n=1 Tax=Anguilla anguilla TaxID=7936 RepID=A0A0E9SVH9_ANGAN
MEDFLPAMISRK